MADVNIPDIGQSLSQLSVTFEGISDYNTRDVSVKEVILGESLLTPGLQTSVTFHSFIHDSSGFGEDLPAKNFDEFKNKRMVIGIKRPILETYNFPDTLIVDQVIYRLDNRKPYNNNIETFTVNACDDSLLNDARSLVSKSWKCTSPTTIVEEVLKNCAKVSRLETIPSTPIRDYIAENIHPFQVVTQQANAALDGDDPSFVHYMTYENLGTHHFKSVKYLTSLDPVSETPFIFSETGISTGYSNPYSIMNHSFPCDFDLLSDILNGIDESGRTINSFVGINMLSGLASLFGNQDLDCGIGGGVINTSKTNLGTEQDQDSCPFDVQKYLLKRQARMSLLEQDKIALKLTVPWNPALTVGKLIKVEFPRKNSVKKGPDLLYGSGTYLIVNLIHNIKNGGYSTTTMECVAQTAGRGVV